MTIAAATKNDITTSNADSTKQYSSDLIVFLDLDLTLIESERKSLTKRPKLEDSHEDSERDDTHDEGEDDDGDDSFMIHLEDEDNFRLIHKRPYLDEFLRQVSSQFETHLFTAGCKEYADAILDELDPAGTVFAKRWYADSCVFSECAIFGGIDVLKDVAKLPGMAEIDPKRFVIVDDYSLTMRKNPTNGIVVSEFRNDNNRKDKTLLEVLKLLRRLDRKDDVRPILKKQFQVDVVTRCHQLGVIMDGPSL
jgi:Dullard-like phosphatase family protein